MNLIWAEEFDAGMLDLSRWNIGQSGKANYTVKDSCLNFYPWLQDGKLMQQGIHTQDKFETPQLPYRVDIRAKLPKGIRWPALWLYNEYDDGYTCPGRPEIDMVETGCADPYGDGTQPILINHTSWQDDGWTGTEPKNQRNSSTQAHVMSLTDQFRVCSVYCEQRGKDSTYVTYSIDGITTAEHLTSACAHPLFIQLCDQYDGPFNEGLVSDPAETLKLNSPFSIDYVRVYG
jgi:hypothetical protein